MAIAAVAPGLAEASAAWQETGPQRVSVRDFGARGDGSTDDRVAIQQAIDAVSSAGGGTVFFPAGVYTVTAPEKEPWKAQISLRSNVTLLGEGMEQSVIRIADDQGAYTLIFQGIDVANIRVMDLTFDGNGSKNPVVCETDSVPVAWKHMIFHLRGGRDVLFLRCRFTALSGVWAVFGSERMEQMAVHSCLFDRIGGYTENDFDHSCVYFKGDGLTMVDNRFASRFGAGTTGVRTAVEVHGSNVLFSDNRISGFRFGLNVCSDGDPGRETAIHQVYRDNHLADVGCGFSIWGLDDRPFIDLEFSGNTVAIEVEQWKDFFPEFYGIGVVSLVDVPPPGLMDNLRILDNAIVYRNVTGGTMRSCGIRLDLAAYRNGWEPRPSGRIDGLEIRGNRIVGACSTGIDLHSEGTGIRVTDNLISDPARMGVEPARACAIRLRGTCSGVEVSGNRVHVDTTPAPECGISDEAVHQGPRSIERNRMLGKGAVSVPELRQR